MSLPTATQVSLPTGDGLCLPTASQLRLALPLLCCSGIYAGTDPTRDVSSTRWLFTQPWREGTGCAYEATKQAAGGACAARTRGVAQLLHREQGELPSGDLSRAPRSSPQRPRTIPQPRRRCRWSVAKRGTRATVAARLGSSAPQPGSDTTTVIPGTTECRHAGWALRQVLATLLARGRQHQGATCWPVGSYAQTAHPQHSSGATSTGTRARWTRTRTSTRGRASDPAQRHQRNGGWRLRHSVT